VADHWRQDELQVDSIHDDEGYRRVRSLLAGQHKRETLVPDIQVARYEHDGDRSITLQHRIHRDRPVAEASARETLKHLARLWGFDVRLEGIREDGVVEYCQECKV
jgi:spore cortex formation protein SpoVR/YcgB (stage V sporulation)